MAEKTLVPEAFGPLQGVKIVSSGTLIAQPFAAALAADMGAEVIQIERPGVGDVGWRDDRHPAQDKRRQGRVRDELGTGAAQRILHLARPRPAARARSCFCA